MDSVEIEVKYSAENIISSSFLKKMTSFLKTSKNKYTYKQAKGFDHYYKSKDGRVLRHRLGTDINELTIKARTSSASSVVRHEYNVSLSQDTPATEMQSALRLMGYKPSFSIYKDCHIFFIQDGNTEISIVFYRVTQPGNKHKRKPIKLFEIEVHGPNNEKSMKLLKKWQKAIQPLLNLKDKDIMDLSLYEIISGNKYRVER